MLAQSLDVIQFNGLCVFGTPVGPKDYVREYVRNKCGTICKDIDQMRVCADPLTDKCLQITTRGLTPSYKHSSRPTHASFKSTSASNVNRRSTPAPAAPVVDQGPQVNSPLLISPLNQLAQLRAARAHGENAENAQEEAAQGLRMLDQRRITAAIM